jgi:sugar-specific transcriptional regulator TrmB
MEGYEERLVQSGLTGNEAKVYLELLRQGELSANEVAKKIGMDRTLAYTILNHLIEKGMVNYVIKSNKKFFDAVNPENLLSPLKEKEIFIKNLIGELSNIKKQKDSPYEINIYEGKQGLRNLLNIIIKHKEMCSFGATGRAYELFYDTPIRLKELEKKGYSARIISSPEHKSRVEIGYKNIKVKYLNLKSQATTSIFGDYVSIHILTQKPFIILIKNKEIAESYRNHFEVLWKIAKK